MTCGTGSRGTARPCPWWTPSLRCRHGDCPPAYRRACFVYRLRRTGLLLPPLNLLPRSSCLPWPLGSQSPPGLAQWLQPHNRGAGAPFSTSPSTSFRLLLAPPPIPPPCGHPPLLLHPIQWGPWPLPLRSTPHLPVHLLRLQMKSPPLWMTYCLITRWSSHSM